MRCVVGVWADDPFDHRATVLCVSQRSQFVWTGAEDGVIVRWDASSSGSEGAFQPTMTLLLHQHPIRMLQSINCGPEMLVSIDRSGVIAVWEAATGSCRLANTVPLLASALHVTGTHLQETSHLAVLTTPSANTAGQATKAPHKAARTGARPNYDPESHLDRLLGRHPTRPTPFEASAGSPLPSTAITLTLVDTATAAPVSASSGRPVPPAVAAIPLTPSALKKASPAAAPAAVAGPAPAQPPQPPEAALAIASFPYGERSPAAQQGSAAGSSAAAHAVLAVTSHGRALVWDTGSTEAPQMPLPDVADTCALHGEPVAAAIAPHGRHIAIASSMRWAVLTATSHHEVLLVPTALRLLHSGKLLHPPRHPPLPLLPAALAGAAFPPVRGRCAVGAEPHSMRSTGAAQPHAEEEERRAGARDCDGDVGATLVLWSEDGTAAVMHVTEARAVSADGGDGDHDAGGSEAGTGEAILGMLPAGGSPAASAARDGSEDGAVAAAQVGFGPGGTMVRMVPWRHTCAPGAEAAARDTHGRACADITNVVCGATNGHTGSRNGVKRPSAAMAVHAWDTRVCVATLPALPERPVRQDGVHRTCGAAWEHQGGSTVPLIAAASACIADVFRKGGDEGRLGGDAQRGGGDGASPRLGGQGEGGVDGRQAQEDGGAERAQQDTVHGGHAWPRTTSRTLLSTSADMPPCMALGRSDGSIVLRPLMFAAVQTAADAERRSSRGAAAMLQQPHGTPRQPMHCSGLGRRPAASGTWGDSCAACTRVLHGHSRPITCMAEADLQRSVISVGIPSSLADETLGDTPRAPTSPAPPRLDSFPEEGGHPVPAAGAATDAQRAAQSLTAQRSLNTGRPRPHGKAADGAGPSSIATVPELSRTRSGSLQATPKGLAALRSIFTGQTTRRQRSGWLAAHSAQSPPSARQSGSFEQESRPQDEAATRGDGGASVSAELRAPAGDSGSLPTPRPTPNPAPPVDISESGGPCQRVLLSGCEAGCVCAWGVSTWHASDAHAAAAEPPVGGAGTDGPPRLSADGALRVEVPGSPLLGPVHDPWSTFGEPLFRVHALAEPVWQIVLPPQNAPAPWHHAIIAVGVHGTAAVIDIFAENVATVLQPPVPTPPHEVAWDASRGLLAIASRPCPPGTSAAASPDPPSNGRHAKPPAAATAATSLIIWDLHTPTLDTAYGGPAAEKHFSQFLRCLRAHYPHGSGLASQHDASTAIRRSHGNIDQPLTSSGHSLSRLSASSNISLGTDATELTFVVSPRNAVTSSHPFSFSTSSHAVPPHHPHLPAHFLRQPHFVHGGDPSTPASSAHHTAFGPLSPHGPGLDAIFQMLPDSVSMPAMYVRPVTRPTALTPLPSPLKPLQLLQMHVGKIVSEQDSSAVAVAAPLLGSTSRSGRRRSSDRRSSLPELWDVKHAQATMMCTALSLTHRWGLNSEADAALAGVLLDCLPGSASFPHSARDAASPLATSTSARHRATGVLRLAEDVLVSQCGAVAVQLPTAQRGSTTTAPAAAADTDKAAGVLWHASRGWLAVRLLFIVSLCRGLQAIVRHLRAAPHACAVLTDLYTHTLTRPQPPAAAAAAAWPRWRRLPPPALGVFVGSWSSTHAVVREAAQLIMAACTSPITVAAAEADAMRMHGAAAQERQVRRRDSLRDLSTRGQHGALSPLFGWEAVPEDADGAGAGGTRPGAAGERAGAAVVSLLPQEVLGILREAPQQSADPMQVLLSAATCAMQPRSIPHSLPPPAVRRLCALALSAPAPHSAAAASILADMLHSAEGHRWQPHLGALPALFSRLHDTVMRVHCAATAPGTRSRSPAAAPRPGRTTRRPGATPASIADWLRKLPARHRALLLLPDIRATYYVRDPESHATTTTTPPDDPEQPPQRTAVPKSPSDSAFRIDRMLSFYHSPPADSASPSTAPAAAAAAAPLQDAHDLANSHTSPSSLPHSSAYSSPSPAELQNTRDTLTALLAALATLDFSAFLHSFNRRVAVGAATDPSTPFHTAVLNAMLAMLRTHSGCEIVLQHVTVLAESMLRLLDPTSTHRRVQTLNAVAALMNQLCMRFPVVAAHNGTSSFAVACPEARHPDARAAATAVQTPVHVYNMSTGAKTFALVLSRAAPGTAGAGNGEINPLAPIAQSSTGETLCGICAIAFRRDGLALAAYSRISGFVYIWTMHPAWLTRMSNPSATRSPFSALLGAATPSSAAAASAQLQPLRVLAAPAAAPPAGELAAGPIALSFALAWAADGRTLELRHESRLLGSMPVQCP
eukprot:jgi/Ulvmu1/5529/UM023_0065.1